jgi:hypothetical protein
MLFISMPKYCHSVTFGGKKPLGTGIDDWVSAKEYLKQKN